MCPPLQRVVQDFAYECTHTQPLGSSPLANLSSEALVKRYGDSHDAQHNWLSSIHQAGIDTYARQQPREPCTLVVQHRTVGAIFPRFGRGRGYMR